MGFIKGMIFVGRICFFRCGVFCLLPSGKHTKHYGKSPLLMGTSSTIDGPFSIAFCMFTRGYCFRFFASMLLHCSERSILGCQRGQNKSAGNPRVFDELNNWAHGKNSHLWDDHTTCSIYWPHHIYMKPSYGSQPRSCGVTMHDPEIGNPFGRDVPAISGTIWLFNIAMENHHF